jgi:hypothetical protein
MDFSGYLPCMDLAFECVPFLCVDTWCGAEHQGCRGLLGPAFNFSGARVDL